MSEGKAGVGLPVCESIRIPAEGLALPITRVQWPTLSRPGPALDSGRSRGLRLWSLGSSQHRVDRTPTHRALTHGVGTESWDT